MEPINRVDADLEFDDPRPTGVVDQLVAVFLGPESDDARLQSEREVLGDQDHVFSIVAQMIGDGEDAMIVDVGLEGEWKVRHRHVVDFDPQRAADIVHR